MLHGSKIQVEFPECDNGDEDIVWVTAYAIFSGPSLERPTHPPLIRGTFEKVAFFAFLHL